MLYQLSYSRAVPASLSERLAQSNRYFRRYGGEGNRTPDLLNAIQALSQLSYTPNTSAARYRLIATSKTQGFDDTKKRAILQQKS